MQLKALSVLTGVTVPLILAGTADAGFVGLKVVAKTDPGSPFKLIDHDNNPATPAVPAFVCNVFATFNNNTPGQDLFIAASGTPGSPMLIQTMLDANTPGGTFYQNSFGNDKAPNAALLLAFPALAYDTFVTIGVKAVGQPGGQPNDGLVLTPGWPGFGPSSLGGTNLGWAVTPAEAQADPFNPNFVNGNGQVLIGQFTTLNANGIVGMIKILVRSNNVATLLNVSFTHFVPAPGALGLLGTAGLVGARRRRRA